MNSFRKFWMTFNELKSLTGTYIVGNSMVSRNVLQIKRKFGLSIEDLAICHFLQTIHRYSVISLRRNDFWVTYGSSILGSSDKNYTEVFEVSYKIVKNNYWLLRNITEWIICTKVNVKPLSGLTPFFDFLIIELLFLSLFTYHQS